MFIFGAVGDPADTATTLGQHKNKAVYDSPSPQPRLIKTSLPASVLKLLYYV